MKPLCGQTYTPVPFWIPALLSCMNEPSIGEAVVTYFCFIESTILSVPHMEPMMADDLDEAKLEAEELLSQHASGYMAHIFEDDERVASIRRDGPTAPGSLDHMERSAP
jgi:hypothetical protein